MQVSTAIILDTRRQKQDNTYPVKLRVTYLRQQKYYATGYSFTEKEFEKIQSSKPRGDHKEIKIYLSAIEQQATEIIKALKVFSFPDFEKAFLDKPDVQQDVYTFFENYIDRLSEEGRAGTAFSYRNAYRSLQSYHKNRVAGRKLYFELVTPEFLKSYERWMLSNGRSATTVGIYARSLRTIMNIALERGIISVLEYPFGKRRYQIPAGRNVKKALSMADIKKVFDYEPQTEPEARSLAMWKFSYLCSGINMKDIARLKYRNIDSNSITFIRAKTERSSKQNLKPVVVSLTEEAKEIISLWGNQPVHAAECRPEAFVFPVLEYGMTSERELALTKQFVKTTNKYLKRAGEQLGFEMPLTTYAARHSFATVLKRSGAPIEFISESLGHGNLKTTESYLASFEDDTRRKYTAMLTDFGEK